MRSYATVAVLLSGLVGVASAATISTSVSLSMTTSLGTISCPAPGVPVGPYANQCNLQYGTVGTSGDYGAFHTGVATSPFTVANVGVSVGGVEYQSKFAHADTLAGLALLQGSPITDVSYSMSISFLQILNLTSGQTGSGSLRVVSNNRFDLGPVFTIDGVAITPCSADSPLNCPTTDIPVSLSDPVTIILTYSLTETIPSIFELCADGSCGANFKGSAHDADLYLLSLTDGGGNAISLSNLVDTPEPGTLGMAMLGIFGLLLFRWKRG
jgi:hypothetical protein